MCASVAIMNGTEPAMQSTEIKKALRLLSEAQTLLKKSNVYNLRRSAEFLNESLQLLQQKAH